MQNVDTLLDYLEYHRTNSPGRPAYTYLSGRSQSASLTFSQLHEETNALAGELIRRTAKGDRVLLLMGSSLEFVVAFWACLYAGRIAVPVSRPSGDGGRDRLISLIDDCLPSVSITTPDSASLCKGLLPDSVDLIEYQIGCLSDERVCSVTNAAGHSHTGDVTTGEQVAYLQYSSGSTGRPKGAMVSHTNVLANARLLHRDFATDSDDSFVGWLPLFHDLGLMTIVVWPLVAGAHSIFCSPIRFIRRPLTWLEMISEYKGSISGGPNFAFDLCEKKLRDASTGESFDLRHWRVAFNGAEPVRSSSLEGFAQALAPTGFDAKSFVPAYGMAEATLYLCADNQQRTPNVLTVRYDRLQEGAIDAADTDGKAVVEVVSCGVPPAETRTIIINPETRTEVAPDTVGEIWTSGESVVGGYWGWGERNTPVFAAYTVDNDGPYFRTGDLGFFHNRELFITGRVKDLVIVNGRNIFPSDIEGISADLIDDVSVAKAAVIGIEDGGTEAVVLIQEIGRKVDSTKYAALVETIHRTVFSKLDLILKTICLVRKGSLPATTSGKIQRNRLKQLYLDEDVEVLYSSDFENSEVTESGVVDPGKTIDSPIEQWLAARWHEMFGIQIVSVDANFLHIGGDSLSMNQMVADIQKRWGVKLDLFELFDRPDLRSVAKNIESKIDVDKPSGHEFANADTDRFPLSPQQKGIWLSDRLEELRQKNNIFFSFRVIGELDIDALVIACNEIIVTHEALRTSFQVSPESEPGQSIIAERRLVPSVIDVRNDSEGDPFLELDRLVVTEASRVFDLANDLLIRLVIANLRENESALLFTMHHIVADGWSVGVFLRELNRVYTEITTGHSNREISNAVPYRRYLDVLSSPEYQRQEVENIDYWKRQLENAPVLHKLQLDYPRAPSQSFSGGVVRSSIDRAISDDLQTVCRENNATLFMGLHAALAGFLSYSTGDNDVVVGTSMANRQNSEFQNTIGCFVNVLPLRSDIAVEDSFEDLLKHSKDVCLQAFKHQAVSFGEIVEAINPVRNAAYQPIVQVMLVLQNETIDCLRLNNTRCELIKDVPTFAQFDLTLEVWEEEGKLLTNWKYSRDIFSHESVEKLSQRFESFLQGLIAKPKLSHTALSLASDGDPARCVDPVRAEQHRWSTNLLQQRFEEISDRYADSIALTCGSELWTYRELNQRANQVAHFLRGHSVAPDSVVGVCVDAGSQALVAILGILKSGAAYLPLDSNYPVSRLKYQVSDANPVLILTQRSNAPLFDFYGERIVCMDEPEFHELLETQQLTNIAVSETGVTAENLAYVIYTSGSTGKPKGVMVEHGNATRLFTSTESLFGFSSDDVWTLFHSVAFDFSVWEIWGALLYGGRLVVVPAETTRRPMEFYELVKTQKITVLNQTPSAFQQFIKADQSIGLHDLSLRCVIFGGEALNPAMLRPWIIAYGDDSPRLINMYGITETTVHVTYKRLRRADVLEPMGTSTIGRPLPDLGVAIMSPGMQLVPAGVVGEMYVSGPGVTRGYLNAPELTESRFLRDPHSKVNRIYRTGDLAKIDENGELVYIGRNDDQVKVRGYRIELGEIESQLLLDPNIDSAVVNVERYGDENVLVAYVVAAGDESTLSREDVFSKLRSVLPDYMLPSSVQVLDSFPLTPNGKLDRGALASAPAKRLLDSVHEEPQGATEIALARLWERVLGVENISRYDNFFDLGGHSLRVFQLIVNLKEEMDRELSVRDLFDFPVLKDLSERFAVADSVKNTDAIGLVDRSSRLPLSWSQTQLYFLNQVDGADVAYLISGALRLNGKLSLDALETALNSIVNRHEPLRSVLREENGELWQEILPHRWASLTVRDLTALAVDEQKATLAAALNFEASTPFDFDLNRSLFRYSLLRVSNSEHVLLITMHHAIADGWSMRLLIEELSANYSEYLQTGRNRTALPQVQYVDYAAWQKTWLTGELFEQQQEFWRQNLSDAPRLLALPVDRPRPVSQSFLGDQVEVQLDKALSNRVKELARSLGMTDFMVLFAGWALLLSRLSGQDDLVLGTPVASRQRPEFEHLIGVFVNTLALRIDLTGNPRASELLQRVKEQCLTAFAHQDIAFDKVVEVVEPERSANYSPLVQVLFNLEREMDYQFDLKDIDVEILRSDIVHAKFDLTMSLIDTAEGFCGSLEFSTALFDRDTVQRWAQYYSRLIDSMLSDIDVSVSQTQILTATEQQQLLHDFNQSNEPVSQQLIHQRFEECAVANPLAAAVIFENEVLSYGSLNDRANQLAHELLSRGIGENNQDLVGIYMHRSPDMVVGILATLKAGCAYLPLDPDHPRARLQYLLGNASPALVLTQQALVSSIDALATQCLVVDDVTVATSLNNNPVANLQFELSSANQQQLAYVIYTSGSTGEPKGVEVEHSGVMNYLTHAASAYFADASGSVVSTALSFDATVTSLLGPLVAGKSVQIIGSGDHQEELQNLKNVIQCSNSSLVLKLTPAHLLGMEIGLAESSHMQALSLHRHQVVIGGEQLNKSLLYRWKKNYLPNAVFINEYGPTETVVGCCTYTLHELEQFDSEPLLDWETVPIGEPVLNTQLYVVDRQGQLVPRGVIGELLIGGEGVARGYRNRPQQTAEKFCDLSFRSPLIHDKQQRVYKTGDLVRYRANGVLEFVGRLDDQVKLRGHRIEPGEIEARLESLGNILEAVVLMVNDGTDGRLVAYVVVTDRDPVERDADECTVDVETEIRVALTHELPEYMIPSQFVVLDSLPLTANGKIDRKLLHKLATDTGQDNARFAQPKGETEIILAGIWQRLLNVERVGRNDDFYQAGGHSLMAIRLVADIQTRLGCDISVRDLFEAPRLKDLARVVDSAAFVSHEPIKEIDRSVALPLSWAQQRLWFITQFDQANTAYHISAAIRIKGALSIAKLQSTLDAVLARHESLRTVFREADGEVQQIIQPAAPFSLAVTSLKHLVDREQECAITAAIDAEGNTAFSLEHGPLIRGHLFQSAEDGFVLLLSMHHIVSDAWSLDVLIEEINALYASSSQDQTATLPALPIQYGDYAVWQREWLTGDALAAQEAYWREQLDGAPALLTLPADRARPAQQSYRGDNVDVSLSPALSDQVRALATAQGLTVHMVLYAAWALLLSRLSGQEDVVVGTPVANRQRQELEGLIGFFVNTLALRTDVSGDPTVAELLQRVKAVCLGGYAHQDIPFERVVEVVQPVRSLSHSPVFQALFDLEHVGDQQLALSGLQFEGLDSESSVAKFDLSLGLVDDGAGLSGTLEYATDLFDRSTVTRWSGYYVRLLEGLVGVQAEKVAALPMLSVAEQERLLNDLNATERAYPSEALVHEQFEARVAETPAATAVVYEGSSLSYAALNARANQLADYLIEQGVKPDTRVGLCMERSLEMVISVVAILKAGGAYVPLDPDYPDSRLQFQMADAELAVVLAQSAQAHRLQVADDDDDAAGSRQIISVDDAGFQSALAARPSENVTVVGQHSRQLAYVLYTSGSTGQPKGVMVEHQALVNRVDWMHREYGLCADDRVLQKTPYSFDVSVWEFVWPLTQGARLVMAKPGGHSDPGYLCEVIEREQISVLHFVPSMFALFVDVMDWSKSPIEKIFCSGEALSRSLVERLYGQGGQCALHNLYGPTEAAIDVSYWDCREESACVEVPIGRPIQNTALLVLDERGALVAEGVAGELHIGGVCLARGYLNRPELTAEKFIADPYSDEAGARLYRTGDLVRWLGDGTLEYLGRQDHQVKLRGQRIELGEIEAALRETDAVSDAVVVLAEAAGGGRLVAYVTTAPGQDWSDAQDAVERALQQRLPVYMQPSQYVVLESIPLTVNGKVDRGALPVADAQVLQRPYDPPQGETEQALAAIWSGLLNLDQVGRQDSFFDLGGHSLLIMQAFNQVKQEFGVELPLQVAYEKNSLSEIAKVIEINIYQAQLTALAMQDGNDMEQGTI